MKKYKVIKPTIIHVDELGIEEEIQVDDAYDLVNVKDETDRIMAAPDEFNVGDIVSEDEFCLIDSEYIDGQGNFGVAPFAFKK